VAWCFYPLRNYLRWVRWGLLLGVIALHMMMQAPVWHLLSRVNVVGGSTGRHRYLLIDAAIKNFDEWWLIGLTGDTSHWGTGLRDITNYYVAVGLGGGIWLLIMVFVLIGFAFRSVGQGIGGRNIRRADRMLAWGIGIALFMHCANFISVTYFGQMGKVWVMQLGLCAAAAVAAKAVPKPRRRPRPVFRDDFFDQPLEDRTGDERTPDDRPMVAFPRRAMS